MKKKGIAVLLVLFFAVTSVHLGMNRVNANNHKDSPYAFDFIRLFDYTEARGKTDKSSCYMKCTGLAANASYTAYVFGSNDPNLKFVEDVSEGYHYLFKKGTKYFLRNWVYEKNYKFASIFANQNGFYPAKASGMWSPDSVPER